MADSPREKGRKNRIQLHMLVIVLYVTAISHVFPASCSLFLYIPDMVRVTLPRTLKHPIRSHHVQKIERSNYKVCFIIVRALPLRRILHTLY